MDYIATDELRHAWGEFVMGEAWDWFATFTFAADVHPETADKCYRVWWHELNRHLDGRRWKERGPGIAYVLASERQRRGVLHFHALLSDARLHSLARYSWQAKWEVIPRDGGIARIKAVDVPALVVGYVTKYVVKGGEIDIGGGALRGASPVVQRSII